MKISNTEQAQFEKMTVTPIPKLIGALAIPTIISMLVTAVYNMADTFFVSRLGTSATGAVGIVFSLMALIQAVGFTLGMGAGSVSSRLLGQKEKQRADQIGSTAFFTGLGMGLLITLLGLCFLNPFMRLLGATETILPFARDYAQYILFGAPVMCGSFVLNNLLRSEGKAMLAMAGIGTGGILNILLDPLFIFHLQLGIAGAAIATLISQCVSFGILLSCFLRKKTILRLHIRLFSFRLRDHWLIFKTGLPSLCRQGLASLATVALNVAAAGYGDAAVAAMSVVGRIFMLVLSVMLGFGQGYQPVLGYNYGAKQYARVRRAFWFSMKSGVVILTVLGAAGFVFAPQLIRLFTRADPQVMEIGVFACRAQCLMLPFGPIYVIANMTFQVLGKSFRATLISSARQGIFFLPLILFLPGVWGIRGVELTQPLADGLTVLCCIPFLIAFFRELRREEGGAQDHTA